MLYWAGPGLGCVVDCAALSCGEPAKNDVGPEAVPEPHTRHAYALHFGPACPMASACCWKKDENKKKSLSERACSLSRWLLTAAAQPNLDYRSLTRDPRPATHVQQRRHSIVSSGSSSLTPRHTPADMIARRLHLASPSRSLPRPAGDVSITCNAPKPSEAVNVPAPESPTSDPFHPYSFTISRL